MKYAVIAWLQFVFGLVLLGGCDYYIRWRDGWLGRGGLPTPEVIWFGVPLVLGAIAAGLLWESTINLQRPWVRFTVAAGQMALGFIIYTVLCLWYVMVCDRDRCR